MKKTILEIIRKLESIEAAIRETKPNAVLIPAAGADGYCSTAAGADGTLYCSTCGQKRHGTVIWNATAPVT